MAASANQVLTVMVMNLEQGSHGWHKLFAPAKINLMLSVHGPRSDGFHELTSVVLPLAFGDEVELRINHSGTDTLWADGVEIPTDDSNLVLQAARLMREESGRSECFDFRLRKNIPVGAGLGGGSSDAVATLKGINTLLGLGMGADRLRVLSASLGSDCPFFVAAAPSVIRGRGERVELLEPTEVSSLEGRRLALFRPDFGIATVWAYRQFVASPQFYEEPSDAEVRLQAFSRDRNPEFLMFNNFEMAVGGKYLAIPCLLEKLRCEGFMCLMSGSGSVCFAWIDDDEQASALAEICRKCWGRSMFWVETFVSEKKI